MTKTFVFYAAAAALTLTSSADAQTKRRATSAATRPEPAACAALHGSYQMAGKKLAWAKVQGDMGGTMAKMRAEQETAAIMSETQTTLALLSSNKCKPPTAAPNRDAYLSQALDCQMAIMAGGAPTGGGPRPACNMEDWKAQ